MQSNIEQYYPSFYTVYESHFSRVRHPSHPGRGLGSLTCHMTQFERSDWLRSENFTKIMNCVLTCLKTGVLNIVISIIFYKRPKMCNCKFHLEKAFPVYVNAHLQTSYIPSLCNPWRHVRWSQLNWLHILPPYSFCGFFLGNIFLSHLIVALFWWHTIMHWS